MTVSNKNKKTLYTKSHPTYYTRHQEQLKQKKAGGMRKLCINISNRDHVSFVLTRNPIFHVATQNIK